MSDSYGRFFILWNYEYDTTMRGALRISRSRRTHRVAHGYPGPVEHHRHASPHSRP